MFYAVLDVPLLDVDKNNNQLVCISLFLATILPTVKKLIIFIIFIFK